MAGANAKYPIARYLGCSIESRMLVFRIQLSQIRTHALPTEVSAIAALQVLPGSRGRGGDYTWTIGRITGQMSVAD